MSDGASWYYSQPIIRLRGVEVQRDRNGNYTIGRPTIHASYGLQYTTIGIGIYPDLESARKGIIALYKQRADAAKREYDRAKDDLKKAKKEFGCRQ